MLRFSKRLIDISGIRDIVQRRIPVMTLNSGTDGPVVWLTGCIHGDEPGGAAIIHDVFKTLRKTGFERGALHALPLINSTGFENVSRFINADREDLNRCFPGNAKGTAGERVARRIFDLIKESEPTLVIDLHNDWIQSVPYVVLEPRSLFRNTRLRARTVQNAGATSLLVVEESESFHETERTLAGALVASGVSAITVEAGGACGIVESSVQAGRNAILGVLRAVGMKQDLSDGGNGQLKPVHVLDYTNRPLCTSSGIIRFSVTPGEAVAANQELGQVYGAFGSTEERLHAIRPGYVLGISDHARALPGSEVIAIAEFAAAKQEPYPERNSESRAGATT
jgi:predicted deacylase